MAGCFSITILPRFISAVNAPYSHKHNALKGTLMNKNENKTLALPELHSKYGDRKIMGVPASSVEPYLTHVYTTAHGAYVRQGNVYKPLLMQIIADLTSAYRYKAEVDPSFKQVIPYVIIRDKQGRTFVTKRLGGDARLTGSHSLGTGGHIDEGENIHTGMYRELREEAGIESKNIFTTRLVGYILDSSSEVNSVHLGLVYICIVNEPDKVFSHESDKLEGAWMTTEQIAKLYKKNKLESWSEIVYENIMANGGKAHERI